MNHAELPPEPVSDLEEAIPDMEAAFPGEAATGLTWDGLVAPADGPKAAEDFGSLDDEEGDLVAELVGYDPGALAPEEAAVHVVDESDAAGVSWDESPDYVGDEAPGGGAYESPR